MTTTHHASADDHKHWHPKDVRTPQSVDEAESALRFIDSMIASCGRRVEHYTIAGADPSIQLRLRAGWESKRAEIVYLAERLRAGDTVNADEVTRERVRSLTSENASLRQTVENLTKRADFYEKQSREFGMMNKGVNPAHVNNIERQNVALADKNKRLSDRIQEMTKTIAGGEGSVSQDGKQRLRRSLHDAYAFGVEAFEEMERAGAVLTPLARLFVDQCRGSMPAGHLMEWRAKDLAFKRAAADATREG